MHFKFNVQYLGQTKNDSGLYSYDFLSLDYKLPFTVYSLTPVESYDKLKIYSPSEVDFDLVLSKDKTSGIKFKVKPFKG